MRFFIKSVSIIALIGYFVSTSACNGDEQAVDYAEQRGEQLSIIFNQGAIPTHTSLVAATDLLSTATQTFASTPTLTSLEALQTEWKDAIVYWKAAEVYDWGAISNSFLHFRIHRWPIDTEAIENAIIASTTEDITIDYIEQQGSSAIGFAALDYLLFAEDKAATLERLTVDTKRRNYLVALSEHLNNKTSDLQARWNTFGPDFGSATEISIRGGQNQLVNALIAYLEESIRLRLGKALGDENGGTIDLSMLETPYAQHSLSAQQAGFGTWKMLYYGNFDGLNNFGFDDYLSTLGSNELAVRIDSAIEDINHAFDVLEAHNTTGNLASILERSPDDVTDLKHKMLTLLSLIKVDLTSIIGATVTVNDTDGD